MLKKWFEREIMAWLNVIFSLANNDVHTKDDVVSDSPPDEVVSRRTLIKGTRGTEVSKRFLWYLYRCSYGNPSDKTQNFYGCAYPDETISDFVCITRSSEARVKTNDRSWYHRGHWWQSVFCTSRFLKNTTIWDFMIREFNKVTILEPRPMPRIDDILINITKSKFISKLNLT